jgi:predicted nucleic-acid-binding protein
VKGGKVIALLDTNVIVRFLISEENDKYKGLYEFFGSLERGEMRVELKLIVLFQVIFVLKSYYKVPKEEIANKMIDLLGYKGIIIKELRMVRLTLEIWRDNNLDIVDCYLIAYLEGDAQNILYSYDHDFDKFRVTRKEP